MIRRPLIALFCFAALATQAFAEKDIPEDRELLDIEIWVTEGYGRYGDRQFSIRAGGKQHPTPTGAFKVEWKSRNWWSRQWDAAMPYAMFYYRGAALHQGVMRGHSKGCIRLNEADAKFLFGIAKEKKTRVFVYP